MIGHSPFDCCFLSSRSHPTLRLPLHTINPVKAMPIKCDAHILHHGHAAGGVKKHDSDLIYLIQIQSLRSALDGMHWMECIGWSALNGVHWMECIGWSALDGVHWMECIGWSVFNGVHSISD